MDEIARVAGVNKALPYHDFRNKEELHRFVLETMIAQISAQMESPAVLSMDPPARVRALVNLTFDFVMRNPAYPRLIQREMMAARRPLHWMVVAHYRPLHQRAVKTIREGIAVGQFRTVDPDQMVFTIFGMIMYYFASGQLASQIWNRDIWICGTSSSAAAPFWIFLSTGFFFSRRENLGRISILRGFGDWALVARLQLVEFLTWLGLKPDRLEACPT